MSKIELVMNKIEQLAKETVIKTIRPNSTYEELADFLNENPVINLLVEGIYWLNNEDFDNFLCSLDISKLGVLEKYKNEEINSLQLSCLLVLPEFSKKIISIYPELIKSKTKENYSPIICAINAMKINDKMEEVVLLMLNTPELCNLDQIHNIDKEKQVYIWEYVCRNGYERIVRKMYNECIKYFKIEETLGIPDKKTPLLDLINFNIEDIAIDMVRNYRDKCYLDKDYGGNTPLLLSLMRYREDLIVEILERYDDCNFEYVYFNGLTAFELLFVYGYHGIILDIIENHRHLYYSKFVHSKGKTPFELSLYQKNWDLAALLVAYKYVPIEEVIQTKIMDIPIKQYLSMNNEYDLIKFFAYIESKYTKPKPVSINENDPGWQKIKELGLENLVKDILKDPISYANNVKDGKINLTQNGIPTTINFNKNPSVLPTNFDVNLTNSLSGISNKTTDNKEITKTDIKPKTRGRKKAEPINLEIKKPIEKTIEKPIEPIKEPKKRGRPRKIKPEE